MKEFYEEIWKDPPDAQVYIGSVANNHGHYLNVNDVADSIDQLEGKTDQYFTPSLVRNGTKKAHFIASRCAWVDLDDPKKEVLRDCTLLPNFIVETSPGHYHLYWLLETWCTDPDQLERINTVLKEDVGGDHCQDCTRKMRVLGTLNSKRSNYTIKLVHTDSSYRYPLVDILALDHVGRKTKHKIVTGDRRGYPSRSERDLAIVGALLRAGISESTIGRIFEHHACGDRFKEEEARGLDYLRITMAKVKHDKEEKYSPGYTQEELDKLYEAVDRTQDVKDWPLVKALGECPAALAREYAVRAKRDLLVKTQRDFEGAVFVHRQKRKKEKKSYGKSLTTAEYIALYRHWGYDFTLNECSDDIELNGVYLSDTERLRLNARVRDYGITQRRGVNVSHAYEALVKAAATNAYHPVKRYLESLKWDGKDWIGKLCSYFTDAEGCEGHFQTWFTHWLIGAVAKVYEGFQNPMLVLDANQDVGKSFFARWLCSPLPHLFNAASIRPDDKDCRLRLSTVWIWEVEELGGTIRRQDIDALKAFLTLNSVRDRKPYGRQDLVKPAMSSCIGTINNEYGFLVDRTGNRRFLPCSLEYIDWAYSTEVNVNEIWAQALHLYREKSTGGVLRLTIEERRIRDEANLTYMVDDPMEMVLSRKYRFTGNWDDMVFYSDLLFVCDNEPGFKRSSRGISMGVASILKAWGCKKRKLTHPKTGHRGTCYLGLIRQVT